MSEPHPYTKQTRKAFWRSAVSEVHFADLFELWQPLPLRRNDRIATAGSCFAQHIGNNLAQRGANFMDLEPAPPLFASAEEARRFGYGVFSCRYGNIYTTRQLVQLFDEAHGSRTPADRVWSGPGNRFYDALRPSVDPAGQNTADSVIALRNLHLAKVRDMFASVDVFVFTLGLTEGWESSEDGTMYPMAPGTLAGRYEAERYRLRNLRHAEIIEDMAGFRQRLKAVNPSARLLLTVSPVPLTATATANHVLVATTYSKAVLRAVAGELSDAFEDVSYFPSYEIISSHPSHGMFFNPDERTVNAFGVAYVMKHFFSGPLAATFPERGAVSQEEQEIMCDEETLARLENG